MSNIMESGDDAPQMFAVQPRTNCPHLAAGLGQAITVDSMMILLLLFHLPLRCIP